jgi:hypothetical protein
MRQDRQDVGDLRGLVEPFTHDHLADNLYPAGRILTRQRCQVAPSTRVIATQPVMGVRDHHLDVAQPALDQALDKARPEWLGFRRTDAETDDLAPTRSELRVRTV